MKRFQTSRIGQMSRAKTSSLNCHIAALRPSFFYFLFYQFFSEQVRVGGRNKNKYKIHSDHFPIESKSKETLIVFPSILIQLENGPNEFYFTN